MTGLSPSFVLQKADGTCNTNFKKTQALEQVTQVLEDFVDRDPGVLVSAGPGQDMAAPRESGWLGLGGPACAGDAQGLAGAGRPTWLDRAEARSLESQPLPIAAHMCTTGKQNQSCAGWKPRHSGMRCGVPSGFFI